MQYMYTWLWIHRAHNMVNIVRRANVYIVYCRSVDTSITKWVWRMVLALCLLFPFVRRVYRDWHSFEHSHECCVSSNGIDWLGWCVLSVFRLFSFLIFCFRFAFFYRYAFYLCMAHVCVNLVVIFSILKKFTNKQIRWMKSKEDIYQLFSAY